MHDLDVILALQFRSVVQREVLRACQTVELKGLREPELTNVNNFLHARKYVLYIWYNLYVYTSTTPPRIF